MWKRELIQIIKKDLSIIKKKNPRYSLRAYSKKIGIGFGSMSDLINNKRNLSPALGKRILEKLSLEKEQNERFSELIESDLNKKVILLPDQVTLLIEKWYYFAILNILELDSSPHSLDEISTRLNLPHTLVKESIDQLTCWGFLKKQNGVLSVLTTNWTTSDNIPSDSIKRAHRDGLALAQRALDDLPVEIRDMTSFVFPGNSKQLDKAKLEVRKCLQKIHKLMSVGELDSIYKFNAQLFPIDQWHRGAQLGKNTKN